MIITIVIVIAIIPFAITDECETCTGMSGPWHSATVAVKSSFAEARPSLGSTCLTLRG
jgi:hypothetical protein